MTSSALTHRHGRRVHSHPHAGVHRHLFAPAASLRFDEDVRHHARSHDRADAESHGGGDSHSHGLVDRSIVRSRAGIRAVAISLGLLGIAAGVQVAIFVLSGSVALLADLIHNFGDALTAVPLAIAFFLRSFRGEKLAGLAVVLAIFVSACVALYETIQRLIHPQHLSHLWVLAATRRAVHRLSELGAQHGMRDVVVGSDRPQRLSAARPRISSVSGASLQTRRCCFTHRFLALA